MTDMEEKKMIEQAKAGDPKAQFEMSQWARQMSILEPNEERWNRLAAKCLVDSAQGGYEPAKAMVQQLISGQEAEAAPAPVEEAPANDDKTMRYVPASQDDRFFDDFETPAPVAREPERSFYDQAEEDDYDAGDEADELYEEPETGFMAVLKKVWSAVKKGAMVAAAAIGGLVATLREKSKKKASGRAPEEAAPSGGRRSSSRGRQSGFSAWVEDNWPVVRIVCIAICVVLAVLIVILLIPPKEAEPEPTPAIAETMAPTPSPTPEPFPNEATKLEISTTATLQYRPGDSDASYYLPASTSFTVQAEVATDDGENLRQGPSGYDYPEVIMRIPNGTKVTAYARYENSEGTVWYLINSGGTWGWMYGPSLS